MKKTIIRLMLGASIALAAFHAPAAITYDASSSIASGANVTSVAWSHTVNPDPTGNGMLVVSVAIETTTTDRPVSSVTYGSQAMTLVPGSRVSQLGSGTYNATEQWYLAAPAAGTTNITVTFPGTVVNGVVAGAVSLFGVNQAAPEAVSAFASAGGDGLYSLNITTLTDGAWLVDVVNNGTGTATGYTPGGSQTERWDLVSNTQIRGAGSTREVTPVGTVANTWTCAAGTSREAHSITAFAPAAPAAMAVAISSPAASATVSTTSFSVNANATVNPGSVTNVNFYVDNILVGNDTSFPFSFAVNGAAAGAHALHAVAWENNGNTATAAVVNVTAANLPPSVAITSPAAAGVFLVGASVSLSATATDDASVTNVAFYVDGSLVASDNSSPFNGSWASATLGAHALTAVATDNGGLSTTSAPVSITAYASFAAYEPFNYTLGTLANNTPSTASGFTGNWSVANTPSIATGLTYPNLPTTANAYQHSATSGRTTVNFLAPISSGTEYISFLIKGSGNSGADAVGIFLKSDNATSLFAGFRSGFSASLTGFGLGSVSSTTLGAATALGSAVNISNTDTNLIVLRIDFNTSGNNDTVSMWINPPAGTNSPGVAANVTYSTYDVGNISAFGFNILGGYTPKIDEFRRAGTYGDVVGAVVAPPAPTKPTSLALAATIGKQVSWIAAATNSYQVQKSVDNSTWVNLGSLISGTNMTSVYDAAFVPYYQVLEVTYGGPGPDDLLNGSFENPEGNNSGAANWTSGANTTYESVWVTNQYGVLTPVSGANLLFIQGATAAVGPTAPNTYLLSDKFAVTPDLAYNVKFKAANPVQVGGANPQYRVRFYDINNILLTEQWRSFASAGNSWTQFSATNTAPANAAFMELYFIQAVGAGASWNWVTLIDDISVNATSTFGPVNTLSPTIKSGAGFTATVQTNGVPATEATGTVTFKTNSVLLSANGVSFGSASSASAILLPPYTVTAIYSGDGTYIGSTNTLTVNSAAVTVTLSNLSHAYDGSPKSATATTMPAGFTVALTYNGSPTAPTAAGTYQVIGTVVDNDYSGSATNSFVIVSTGPDTTPTNIVFNVSGNQLTLNWPESHLGWILQTQTSDLSAGITDNWTDVPGSESSTSAVITIDAANPSVFFRLRLP